jgi:hypothetical protein
MKNFLLLLPLSCVALFLIGCEEDTQVENNKNNSNVVINQIEKSITKKDTSLGCTDNKTKEECSEESDSTQFILNTLSKESSRKERENIASIKENLNRSLKKISKEEQKTEVLKESLVAFVNSTNKNRGKDLENFINKIGKDDKKKELGASNSNRIALIKDELSNLMLLEEPTVKSKEIKKRLENLMSDITTSKRTLSQTKTTLQNLVDKVERTGTKSDKKFANAIIKDVSSNKISILEENENYFIITVQEGDNLSILAKRYYSNTDKFKLIYEANKDKINSKYEIYPGSKLLIPKI